MLSDMLKLGGVQVGLKAVEKEDAIDEMLSYFCKEGHFSRNMKTKLKSEIMAREDTGSTGIGNGGAIPHCRIGKDDEVQLFIGIADNEIEYQSIDGKPVQVMFMVILPKNNSDIHAGALKSIASMMRNERFFRYLKEAKTIEEVYETIQDYEKEES